MGSRLRILHTADSHIGSALPVRPRREGPRRGDDLVDSFSRVLRQAFERDVDLVIHSGDLFNRSKPSSRALAAAAEPLLEVAASGIPVVIVPGNHERSEIPATLLLAHPNIHIISEPTTLTFDLRGTRVAIAGFPCLRRDSANTFAATLDATGWSKTRADLRILAAHQTFESATCGPANYRFRSGDDVVERDALPAAFDYVAAGHVHRHQTLTPTDRNGPPIVYSGSPDRVSFAEKDEPKGFMMIEQNGSGLTPTFVEHPVRPMSLWPVDVTGLTQSRILHEIQAIAEKLPPQAIAQVRLSGCSTSGALRGLQLTTRIREQRPDVLFSVTARAVEFAPERVAKRSSRPLASAFSHLDAPPAETTSTPVAELSRLPTCCGVYAMYDADGRLLYVGKSGHIRTRVRAHLRGKTGANFFSGWSRQIARIDARLTDSDLEALLIEAELIRTLRPPFNRQMRRWAHYCYLRENGRPHGQLEVCPQPGAGYRCFGPFRSRQSAADARDTLAAHFGLARCPDEPTPALRRPLGGRPRAGPVCKRYHQGTCSGPCAERVEHADYDRRINARAAVLTGKGDSTVRKLEAELETATAEGCRDDDYHARLRQATTLRATFDQSAIRREAERLMHGLLLLPGPAGLRKTALPAPRGIRFDVLGPTVTDAKRILRHARTVTGRTGLGNNGRLPKTAMDSLCIVARQLRRASDEYGFIARRELAGLDEQALLAKAYDMDYEGAGQDERRA